MKNCPVYMLKHMSCYYQGQWLDGLPHGCGIAIFKNLYYYEGEFDKGELQSDDSLFYFSNVERERRNKEMKK